MKNILEYKGYYTKIEFSIEDKVLHGKIEGINDLVNFEAENAADIEKEFHNAVDDYLEFCERTGTEPSKPYRGVFNIRLTPEKHRLAAKEATNQGITLNQFVCQAVDEKLSRTVMMK